MSNATTKRKLIDDKRPSQGDSGQRLDSPESTVLTRPKIRRCYSNKVLQNESVKPIADCYTTRKNKSCDKSGDKDDKSLHSYSTKMIVDQINEVENILADMKQKLEVRYNSKKQNNGNNGDTVETMKIETDELDVPKSEIELKLPEIPISNIQNNNNIKNEILETFEYPDLFVVYSNVEEERIRKNKLNNKTINEMDHGDNNSAISRHIKSNSNDTVSPNKSINFVTQVTKRKSIDDKRPSRGDNGQRLDNPESPVYENYRNEHDSNKRLQQQQKQQPQQPQQPQQQEQQPLPQQQPQQQQQEQQPQQSKTRYRTRGKRGGGKSRAAWRRRNRGGGWGGRCGG